MFESFVLIDKCKDKLVKILRSPAPKSEDYNISFERKKVPPRGNFFILKITFKISDFRKYL